MEHLAVAEGAPDGGCSTLDSLDSNATFVLCHGRMFPYENSALSIAKDAKGRFESRQRRQPLSPVGHVSGLKWVRRVQDHPHTRIEVRRILEDGRAIELLDVLQVGEGREVHHRETVRL